MLLRRVVCSAFCAVSLFLTMGVFRPLTAFAGLGFQPPNPEELKMTGEPLAPGAPAVVLYHQVDRDDNGRTSHEDQYFRIKILTEEGRKYASVEIPSNKEEDVVNIHGRTIHPDGSIVDFDGKVLETSLLKGRDVHVTGKTFTLPAVEVGSVLEYSYTIDLSENLIFNSHWILSTDLFTKNARFSLKPYNSPRFPWTLRWTWQGLPNGLEPKEGPDRVVRMEASNIAAFRTEDFMPPANELKARCRLYLRKHTAG